ncbi:MAG TPA: FAD-binding oxidoreductase [bacterium]|nr:FAD-binding oxidoreductase [bacterium]
MYKKLTEPIVSEIEGIVGKENVLRDKEKLIDYSHDEFALSEAFSFPEIVVKVANTQQVAEIVKIATREKIPVVARGGGTGLCGGCIPSYGGIVVSTEKINKILEIDQNNLMAHLESGVTLKEFYQALKIRKLFFPPHPGEESATIGGLVSTNAGGARAVKYGTVRNFIRGLTVVCSDGKIIQAGGKIIKDSTGYNLIQLFTGSEGTLGIITEAILSVMPEPDAYLTVIAPFHSTKDALKCVPFILKSSARPLAIEFISKQVISIAGDYCGKHWPSIPGEIFLMIILEGTNNQIEHDCETIASICMENKAVDIFVAQAEEKQQEILHVRSIVYQALKSNTIEILDITVPPAEMACHIDFVEQLSNTHNIWLPTYGHAGDGNLHTHITKKTLDGCDIENWKEMYTKIRQFIIVDGIKRGGRISGEHGIGLVKKQYLDMCFNADYIEILRKIKKVFDPFFILNPGKIFDPE